MNASSDINAVATFAIDVVEYQLGTVGPGGGKIFYKDMNGFICGINLEKTCNYLEAATTNSATPWTDIKVAWSGNYGQSINCMDCNSIGKGLFATNKIVTQPNGGNTPNMAGTATRAYDGGGQHDWYLPSIQELIALRTGYTNNWVDGARFEWQAYWSSSEYSAGQSVAGILDNFAIESQTNKDNVFYVRPIRAF
jgi:hypothetical protein